MEEITQATEETTQVIEEKKEEVTQEVTEAGKVEEISKPESTEAITIDDIVSGKEPKKKGVDTTPRWAKDRFDELTKKIYDRDARIKELESSKSIPSDRPMPPLPPILSDFVDESEKNKALGEYRKAVVEYEDNLDTWKQHHSRTEAEKVRQEREFTENSSKFMGKAESMRVKYPDFDEVVGQNIFTLSVVNEIYASDFGPEIGYYLAKNPALAMRLGGLTPTQIAKEIGKLENKFSEAINKKPSSAPPPIKPVEGSDVVNKDPSKMTDAEWFEWDKQERMRKVKEKLQPK